MNKPAIILITCDELLTGTLSCYGNRAIDTPNIDSLQKCGTDFVNTYTVSPWCLPARCSALTGQYPHKSKAYSNFRPCKITEGDTTLFSELRELGYHTSMIGKCHFIAVPYGQAKKGVTQELDGIKDYYLSLGLDHLTLQDGNMVSVWFYDDFSRMLEQDGVLKEYRDAFQNPENHGVYTFNLPLKYHPDAWAGDRAREYIDAYDSDQPFFTWISFGGPHYPMNSPQEYIDMVDREKLPPFKFKEGELDSPDRVHHKSYHGGGNIDACGSAPGGACKNFTDEYWEQMVVNYNANVKLIDDKVGEILESVQRKFGDNALVIFTADHGDMVRNHGLWGKHNCAYDEVWRIPLLAKFPNQTEPKRDMRLANTLDILPTCVDVAGGEGRYDGISLLQENDRTYTFSEGEGFVAVTDGRYKYIHVQKGPNENFRELIDTEADPNEFENRINDPAYTEILSTLRAQIIEHFMPDVLR